MRTKLQASESQFNFPEEALFCIRKSAFYFKEQQKQDKNNRLTFNESLKLIKKEKIYGPLLNLTARMFPQVTNSGKKYLRQKYSKPRSEIKPQISPDFPEKFQAPKKYPHRLSEAKHQSQAGGIDSFWMFKKKQIDEQKKNRKISESQKLNTSSKLIDTRNQVESAYLHILTWNKQSPDLTNSFVSKNQYKGYISSIFGQNFAIWFINFYQVKAYMNFKEFESLVERFRTLKLRQSHLVSFFLYDANGDGFISPTDTFSVFQKQHEEQIDQDIFQIVAYLQKNMGKEETEEGNQRFKIEHVTIRDEWLTVRDYELLFKKIDQPYLKATNKKDTVFSNSFAVLDHREKMRSRRKEVKEKKHMFEELFGNMTKEERNGAYIEKGAYRLNYTFFYEIFESEESKLFQYFKKIMFGLG